jgi:hypothetical protein
MRLAALCRPLRSALRVLAVALPVMGLFTTIVMPAAGLLAWWSDSSFGNAYALATICGLVAWLFVAVFHFRQETLIFPIQNRQAFLGRLRAQLKALGYCVKVRQNERQVFKPAFQALLLGGRIRLRIKGDFAQLDGPRMFLEILRKRLRVQNHLEKDLKIFWDAKRRHNERLLRRAQITLHVTGKPWQSVCRQIIEALQREGAAVQCDVILRAHSEEGIREHVVEDLVRAWLVEKDIPTDITKERLGGLETGSKFDFLLSPTKSSVAICLEDTQVMVPAVREPQQMASGA